MQQATNALAHPPDSSATLPFEERAIPPRNLCPESPPRSCGGHVAVLHCHFWPLFVCMQPVRPVTRPLSSVIPPVIGHAALLLALLSIALIQRSHAVSANVRGAESELAPPPIKAMTIQESLHS